MSSTELRDQVRERYAQAAREAESGACCCESACCGTGFGTDGYGEGDLTHVPELAANVSLGCGNPTAVADLHRRVLALGHA